MDRLDLRWRSGIAQPTKGEVLSCYSNKVIWWYYSSKALKGYRPGKGRHKLTLQQAHTKDGDNTKNTSMYACGKFN